ncbi:MAG TPA: VTT domain-containing protein [Noviherbaspirillum sp.]|uniref:VTT domain-containing protein n=1 Tax=Noviherbaspirillum sp. TaxID=1926288 RepID=UPI002B48FFF0|nr:VTT domain-containing protein [Noviherbaspirillum sp.]HJV86496.1 VTT domain-containing protein [Noviherbaspirillum sp.]
MPLQDTETCLEIPGASPGLLKAGRNCWRIEHVHRFAMLVDADAYFRAVRAAVREARHSIYILSWDIDSRTWLVPQGANDGYPEPLGDFLHAVVASRPGLHAYVLNWDFAMLYALEREWLPVYKMEWRTHRRLAFRMDGRHPLGASHHQKVVVVDDRVAFVGGLDLTRCRWDTPAHSGVETRRRDSDGKPHGPFHDVQAMVDGDAARALGELARARWRRVDGKASIDRYDPALDPWPQDIVPDLTDVDVAISRTEPSFDGANGVHEVRQLHLDAIAAARRTLFFENQYFTSGMIAGALAARLAEPDGPEVMIVSPKSQSGWLEEATMGVLRARVHRRLKEADHFGRYRMLCPHLPDLNDGQCLNVHSKVFAVDDRLFSIGSANLSNRSMALDTECNLTIEACGPDEERIASVISRLRSRLLAEHMDTSVETMDAEVHRHNSLHRAVDALQHSERALRPLDPVVSPELDALIPEQALFDPETPIDPDELVVEFVPSESRKPLPRRLTGIGALAIALALLAIAWRWTPLRDWINLGALVAFARGLDELPFTPIAVIASYVVAGVLVVPVTLLIAVTGIVFGPLYGSLYAIAGTLLSAAVTYGLGHWLGRDVVQRLLGERVNRLSKRIAKRGILAMIVVRILPVAPYSVVNVVAGASHIRLRDFLIGTLLGMMPGIMLTVTFVHQLAEAVRNPSPETVAVLGAVAVVIIAVAIGLQRLLKRREDPAA